MWRLNNCNEAVAMGMGAPIILALERALAYKVSPLLVVNGAERANHRLAVATSIKRPSND